MERLETDNQKTRTKFFVTAHSGSRKSPMSMNVGFTASPSKRPNRGENRKSITNRRQKSHPERKPHGHAALAFLALSLTALALHLRPPVGSNSQSASSTAKFSAPIALQDSCCRSMQNASLAPGFVSRLAEQSSLMHREYGGPSHGSEHYNRRLLLHLPASRQHFPATALLVR